MIAGEIFSLNQTISDVSENASAITSEITWGDLVFIALLLLIAYGVGIIVAHFMKLRLSDKMKKDQLVLATNIMRVLLFFIAIAVMLPGVFHLSIAIVALLVAGFVIVLAMSSSAVIGNAAAGAGLLYERTFSPGDFVKVNDITGTVVAVHLLSIQIRTTAGVLVRIPNNMLYSTTLSNFHAHVARRYDFEIGIRSEHDPDVAMDTIREIIEPHTFVLKNPAPEVFVSAIEGDSLRIRFRFWVPSVWANTQDDILLQTGFLADIKTALGTKGIDVPYSRQIIWFANKPAYDLPGNDGTR